ncbi:MAG: ArdC family protein [Pseudomonadota bacterium]|uniref:ArdC family protein n=1 Tax=Roseovarius salincola TaxID=2978479 RepID=UPI0022A828C4|nr:ArdC family protein [Roseovarius sp. EGI FJ00037]MCZ0813301.1 ArdC family protein [Roseovarius sp. EGI FJ00037]
MHNLSRLLSKLRGSIKTIHFLVVVFLLVIASVPGLNGPLEAGTPAWRRTGSASGIALPTRHNGEEYREINILMLWVMAAKRGYVSGRCMTYKQVQ